MTRKTPNELVKRCATMLGGCCSWSKMTVLPAHSNFPRSGKCRQSHLPPKTITSPSEKKIEYIRVANKIYTSKNMLAITLNFHNFTLFSIQSRRSRCCGPPPPQPLAPRPRPLRSRLRQDRQHDEMIDVRRRGEGKGRQRRVVTEAATAGRGRGHAATTK